MSKLLLVRHGETELSRARRFCGSSDVELSDTGLKQVERLRDRLATQKIDTIYSSDLQRALVTAETIASKHHLNVITCPELREMDYGNCEGLTFDEINRLYPELTESWIKKSLKFKFPGGESLDGFSRRVSKFLGRLEKHAEEETVLIAAHSGTLRMLVCQLLDIELQLWWRTRLDFTSLTILGTYPQEAVLSLLNDISHLE